MGMELMMALPHRAQGVISTIMLQRALVRRRKPFCRRDHNGGGRLRFFESIPLWAVTLIGGLFITVLSFVMIMTVYGRFCKLYLYSAIAPIPLSSFAGEPSQNVGRSFLKSLRCRVFGRRNHCALMHHLLSLLPHRRPLSSRRCGRNDGVELYRGANLQHAHPGRFREDVRPDGR